MTENKNGKRITKAICNKGFRGNSSILPRIKFGVGGQESSPQSLTAYSLNRWQQADEKDHNSKNDRNNDLRMEYKITIKTKK